MNQRELKLKCNVSFTDVHYIKLCWDHYVNFGSSYTPFIDFVSTDLLAKGKLYIGIGTGALY